MPVPTPHKGESQQEFMVRCMPFVTSENEKKPESERRSHAQLVAMCLGQFGRKHMQFHADFTTKMLGNALLIEGDLLQPGTYVGLDGVPTKYSEEFIHKLNVNRLIGQPIKFAHEISPEPMASGIPQGEGVGYWTGVTKNGKVRVRGYMFDPRAILYAKSHPKLGLSMEADVATHQLGGFEEATDGMLTGGVLIDDPACSTCRVITAREVNLQRSQEREENKSENMGDTQTAESFIAYTTDVNLAGPTRDKFFSWLEEQLKGAGITEESIGKVMGIVKKAIKSPYPYPSPKAQEALELEYGKELAGFLTIALSAYTDCVGKEMKAGKSMADAAKVCTASTKKEEPVAKPLEAAADSAKLAERLGTAEAQLANIAKEAELKTDMEITTLTSDIKALEKEFEPTKFLEGIECKLLQKKMLGKYLEVLKKNVKPIKLQVAQETEEKAKTMIAEMLGPDVTFESIFEIKPKGE